MSEDILNTYLTEDPNLLPSMRNLKAVCVRVCVCVRVYMCVCVCAATASAHICCGFIIIILDTDRLKSESKENSLSLRQARPILQIPGGANGVDSTTMAGWVKLI